MMREREYENENRVKNYHAGKTITIFFYKTAGNKKADQSRLFCLLPKITWQRRRQQPERKRQQEPKRQQQERKRQQRQEPKLQQQPVRRLRQQEQRRLSCHKQTEPERSERLRGETVSLLVSLAKNNESGQQAK